MEQKNLRKHIVISGVGRSGTTFLVKLLTELGFDTGFNVDSKVDQNARAGLELDLRKPDAPHIVKHPWLCDYIDEIVDDESIQIEWAIIPMRDLQAAAESRRFVTRNGKALEKRSIPGGLWHTSDPQKQEEVLAKQLYRLMNGLARKECRIKLLSYPRLVNDPSYLYRHLSEVIEIKHDSFLESFNKICRPELIHSFTDKDK